MRTKQVKYKRKQTRRRKKKATQHRHANHVTTGENAISAILEDGDCAKKSDGKSCVNELIQSLAVSSIYSYFCTRYVT